MLYVILGIVIVVAMSALLRKPPVKGEDAGQNAQPPAAQGQAPQGQMPQGQSPQGQAPQGQAPQGQTPQAPAADAQQQAFSVAPIITQATPEAQEPTDANTHVAPTISSSKSSASAVYSPKSVPQSASTGKDAYGLHWTSRTSSLDVNGLVLQSPMVYWSESTPGVGEPSCIDMTLPYEIPSVDEPVLDGAESYQLMTPSQRGAYLMWIAGGKVLQPPHVSWPTLWFMGIERRVLFDKQDVPFCVYELLRMLPIIRWEQLNQAMQRLIVWLSVKTMIPEEQILRLITPLSHVPQELFSLLLYGYSSAELPIPSYLAYVIMRSSPLAFPDLKIPYTETLIDAFGIIYKKRAEGGLVPSKPRTKISVVYQPINKSLPESSRKLEVLDIPDFFKDPMPFSPLIEAWSEFTDRFQSGEFGEDHIDDTIPLERRADWEAYVNTKLNGAAPPLIVPLDELATLMQMDKSEKPTSAERREICETARVEGFLLVPELGVPGKEYDWYDNFALMKIAMGERISDSYNCCAFVFEFAAGIETKAIGRLSGLSDITQRVMKRFSLAKVELDRFSVLSRIINEQKLSPENLGECLQVWYSQEDLEFIRDFMYTLLAPAGRAVDEREALLKTTAEVLGVKAEYNKEHDKFPMELGEKLISIIASLFKNK